MYLLKQKEKYYAEWKKPYMIYIVGDFIYMSF